MVALGIRRNHVGSMADATGELSGGPLGPTADIANEGRSAHREQLFRDARFAQTLRQMLTVLKTAEQLLSQAEAQNVGMRLVVPITTGVCFP